MSNNNCPSTVHSRSIHSSFTVHSRVKRLQLIARRVIDTAVALILTIWLFSKVTEYFENLHSGFFVSDSQLSNIWLIIPSIFIAWIVLAQAFIFQFPPSLNPFRFSTGLIYAAGTFVSFLGYVLPVYHTRNCAGRRGADHPGPV